MRRLSGLLVLSLIVLAVLSGLRSDWKEGAPPKEQAGADAGGRPSGTEGEASSGRLQSAAGGVARTHDVAAGAVLEGIVTYEATPQHRWRQARYYVRNPGEGQLAEAVVSLRGSNLQSSLKDQRPETRTIDQKDFQFVPETLAIRVRDSVKFTNSDRELHNVRTLDGARPFNIGLPAGQDYVHEFRRAGGIERPVRLGCAFHGTMRAWIYVFDHAFFQVTAADGRFRFENVPPGEYWLDMVHPAGGLEWSRRIEVEAGNTLKVDISVSPDDRIRTDDHE